MACLGSVRLYLTFKHAYNTRSLAKYCVAFSLLFTVFTVHSVHLFRYQITMHLNFELSNNYNKLCVCVSVCFQIFQKWFFLFFSRRLYLFNFHVFSLCGDSMHNTRYECDMFWYSTFAVGHPLHWFDISYSIFLYLPLVDQYSAFSIFSWRFLISEWCLPVGILRFKLICLKTEWMLLCTNNE